MYECEVGEEGKQDMYVDVGVSLAYTACTRHKSVFDKSGWMVAVASVTFCRVKGDV